MDIGRIETSTDPHEKSIGEARYRKIRQACDEFENIFVKMMVDKMWSSVNLFNEEISFETEIWQDTFTAQVASEISQSSDIGISEAIYTQIIKDHISQDDVR